MNKTSEVSYLRSIDSSTSRKFPKPAEIQAVYSCALKGFKELMQSMFDAVDDSLFELANNARSNNEQNRYFETMREVRIKRKTIETNFEAGLKEGFEPNQALNATPTSTPPADSESLSLVNNDDMEQSVAIKSMATKAKANYQGTLLDLQNQFSDFYAARQPDSLDNPLNPEAICKIFATACDCLEIELRERLLILKQFDRFVMSRIDDVLEQTSKKLSQLGVNAVRPRPAMNTKPPQMHEQGDFTNNEEPELFAALRAMLVAQRQQPKPSTAKPYANTHARANEQALSPSELLVLLNRVQQQLLQDLQNTSNAADVTDIHSAIRKQLASSSRAFSPVDEDLISLVGMLFDFILDDYNLAPSVQVLISRLQIPVLKVVIQDKSFFSSSHHPARSLLNTLAKAGIGWSEAQDKSKDPLYQKIHETVHRVLDEFDGNISLFAELLADFSSFLQREERRAAIVEQRTREAEEGRILTKQAHQKVEDTLSKQIVSAHHAIPEVVIDTLKNGWSRVMFLAYLKDSEEHQWQNTVDVSRDLIWCLQPLTEPKDRQRWITIVPKLLKDLEAGLQNVSYNSSNLKETVEEVKQALTSTFKESSYTQTGALKDKLSKRIETKIRKARESNQELNSQHANTQKFEKELEKISALEIGQWVEFTLRNGYKQRCKLSAHIHEADSYIFVNRMGLKPIERSRMELADDLANKRAVLLDQGLLIDRALHTIASNLRQSSKA